MRPLKGAVPHCRARARPSQLRAGVPGEFVQVPSVQSGCFQPISSSHQQQLPTSGDSISQEPVQRQQELGGSEPQACSLCGKGEARLLGKPREQRAGACKCPLFSQAQILSRCTPKPFPAALCPQPALPSAERLQGFPVSPEPETKHSALAATGRILPRNHNFSSASPAVCLPVLPHFPLGRAAGSCQHSWFMGTAATGTAQSSSNPLARECVLRLSVTAKSHSLAFPSGLENPVTDLITQGMPQNSCSLPCREATGRAGAGVYCYNILKHSAPKDNTDKRRQLDNNHDFEQSKHGING